MIFPESVTLTSWTVVVLRVLSLKKLINGHELSCGLNLSLAYNFSNNFELLLSFLSLKFNIII